MVPSSMTVSADRDADAVSVAFSPANRRAVVPRGETLLHAAQQAGVDVPATCGARGRCRSCRVQVTGGPVPPPTLADRVQLGEDEVREQYRLACQAEAWDDLLVRVAPDLREGSLQILTDTAGWRSVSGVAVDSGVVKLFTPAAGPTRVLFGGREVASESGDTRGEMFGLAFDVGTTTIVGYLVDLAAGTVVATTSAANPQAAYGGDLMSRLAFAQVRPENARALHTRLVRAVNEQIEEATARAGVARERIYKIVVVGNTVMHHTLLGLNPTPVGHAPFTPLVRDGLVLKATDVGLRVTASVPVCLLPNVAGFVGADAVAMILSTRIDQSPEPRIAVDIGTNGEVAVGWRDRLLASSAPAGPALEGAELQCGMRATHRAIDHVAIATGVRIHVIGDVSPLGVCGSGVLDAIAGLLDAGLLDPSGRLTPEPPAACAEELRRRLVSLPDGSPAFVLAWGPDTATGRDLVISQADIRQVQLAKAAIRSGIVLLQRLAGVPDRDVAEVLLAGAFGNYLNVRSAVRVGLIPALPRERIRYVGNAAGLGAQLALISERERRRAEDLAARVQHVSVAGEPGFQDVFVDALRFEEAAATGGDERRSVPRGGSG